MICGNSVFNKILDLKVATLSQITRNLIFMTWIALTFRNFIGKLNPDNWAKRSSR